MNKYLCILPWIHLHIAPDGDVFPCCISTDGRRRTGNYHQQPSLVGQLNSPPMKALRLQMLLGERPEVCATCWNLEEANPAVMSMRKFYTLVKFKGLLGLFKQTGDDGELAIPRLFSVDARFSNVCNFKCRMCNAKQSHLIAKEEAGPEQTPTVAKSSPGLMLVDDIMGNLDTLAQIEFAGGECLLQSEHYQLLEQLIAAGRTSLLLNYSSNLSTLRFRHWRIDELWQKFSNVVVRVSVDHIGERAEYIRHGLCWKTFNDNLELLSVRCPHVLLGINCVVSIFNIYTLANLLREFAQLPYFADHGLGSLRLTLLQTPSEMAIDNIPDDDKRYLSEQLRSVASTLGLAGSINEVVDHMNSGKENHQQLRLFFKRQKALDQKRGKNLLLTFPELGDLYNRVASASDTGFLSQIDVVEFDC